MTKHSEEKLKTSYSIKLPNGTIHIGSGTVPTSATSVSKTSVKEMVSELRKASKEGLFDTSTEDYGKSSAR